MTGAEIRWENPPDKVLTGSRSAPHRDGVAAQLGNVVEQLQAHPGRWCLVFKGGRGTLNSRVQMMRAGAYGFSPPQRWHIVTGKVDPDHLPETFGIWARYLPAETAAAAQATAAAPAPQPPPPTRAPIVARPAGVTRLPAASDLGLLCDCGHVRRLHPDAVGTYRGLCRRTGCDCGGYAPKVATSS